MLATMSNHPHITAIETGFRMIYTAGHNAQKKHADIAVEFKGDIDLVTNIDIETEKFLIHEILQVFPDHSIISEECADIESNSPYCWIIDPIDGTTNFAHHLPIWAISIAFYKNQQPIAGWVYAPELNQLFFGLSSYGSWLNFSPIHVSPIEDLSAALLATGFPYDIRDTPYTNLDLYEYFSKRSQAVRRFGSASLDICFVSCGMVQGYWEQMLQLWDFAAARIILEEAGGKITDMYNAPLPFCPSSVVCSNPILHSTIVREIHISGAVLRNHL
ncbi:MAG: inositol monophosphatase family protein [Caldisericia bacterium]|nr:inositol monophosphatase family protein [Caldisericia bacterium]